ncbi:hypothetical protein T492DRAFT_926289 [Pavlovales sp. CCMP2436]|nr:hypothetical protein T492DRAFT_926289 [Pavlovales sp. CCMP2436]
MLLPTAAAVCALTASRCCPLEVLAGTSRPPVSLGSSSGCASRACVGCGGRGATEAGSGGRGAHTHTLWCECWCMRAWVDRSTSAWRRPSQ